MSAWLTRARERRAEAAHVASAACANCANSAKTPNEGVLEGGFGTFGTIGTAPLVPVAEVRGRILWQMRRFRDEGLPAEAAAQRAMRLVVADLRNDPRLVPLQENPRVCLMCGDSEGAYRVLGSILTPKPGEFLWMHLNACHGAYVMQQKSRAEELIRTAMTAPYSDAPSDSI